jgi:2-phospho-L-lactate guanylyltransferase
VAATTTAAVLVPVKAFAAAKQRLAAVLDQPARVALATAMATTVLEAAGGLRVAVVCDDHDVRGWAEAQGAEAIWTPGLGLNGAVEAGVAHLARRGVDRVVVAHADLPLATDLAWVADTAGVTLVPDRHRDGTNVACVPAPAAFAFAYGPGSFAAHRAEARRLGLPVRLVLDPRLGWDVDVPADLTAPMALDPPAYLSGAAVCP